MSEKRFEISKDKYFIFDNIEDDFLDLEDVVNLLNKQEDTIITLKRRLEMINGGYGHLTHRNGLTANEWVIKSQEKKLKKKNEQISEWIEQHTKDIAMISKQNKVIQNLKKENKQLKQEVKQYWKYRNVRKQKVKDLEKQLKHIQNLIHIKKMQDLGDE